MIVQGSFQIALHHHLFLALCQNQLRQKKHQVLLLETKCFHPSSAWCAQHKKINTNYIFITKVFWLAFVSCGYRMLLYTILCESKVHMSLLFYLLSKLALKMLVLILWSVNQISHDITIIFRYCCMIYIYSAKKKHPFSGYCILKIIL